MPSPIVSPYSLPADDLEHVFTHTAEVWDELRGSRLFITGGTGFFGRWLLETFLYANERMRLGAQALVLSRDPAAFAARHEWLVASPHIELLAGDVRDFAFPRGEFTHVIHAAADARQELNEQSPLAMFDTIVTGTRRVLDFALVCGAKKMLNVSSGAVYGAQPPELLHVTEDYGGGPDVLHRSAAYGEAKRSAELIAAAYHRQHGLDVRTARCFAFVGPGLPLDVHFAVGNFLRDALRGEPIRLSGDGRPVRSYLYAADLAIWLWRILFRGAVCRPYNVGSDVAVPISELASLVAALPSQPVEVCRAEVASSTGLPPRYVPSIVRALSELVLDVLIPLDEALRRTWAWHRLPPVACAGESTLPAAVQQSPESVRSSGEPGLLNSLSSVT